MVISSSKFCSGKLVEGDHIFCSSMKGICHSDKHSEKRTKRIKMKDKCAKKFLDSERFNHSSMTSCIKLS